MKQIDTGAIGETVLWQPLDTFFDDDPVPAIIIEVFDQEDSPGSVGLAILERNGIRFHSDAQHSELLVPGFWSWRSQS